MFTDRAKKNAFMKVFMFFFPTLHVEHAEVVNDVNSTCKLPQLQH